MHERQSPAGDSVEVQKKTVWYGVGKAVEKGARALGPESWRKRILHIIDTQIIPRSNSKWQEWAKNHREEIEHVAETAGVSITVVEVAAGSVAILLGAKRFTKLLEQSRLHKKLEKRWGKYHPSPLVDKVVWVKNPPSELSFFQAQIFDKFSKKFGVSTARNVSDTMTTLVSYKDIFTQRNRWNRIVSLANAGKVSTALLLLENIFQEGFTAAGNKYGWGNEIPKEYTKDYARKFLLPLWLETPQVEELAFSGEQKRKHSTNDVMDAFARIRDHMQTPNYLRSYRNQTRLFLKTHPSDQQFSSGLVSAIESMRKYLLHSTSSESIITDSIPSSLVNDAVLGQHQSVSPRWAEQFQNHLEGIVEEESFDNSPIERYFNLIYDRKPQDLLRNDRLRPVKFKMPKTLFERIKRILQGKKNPQQIREPFLDLEDFDEVIFVSGERNPKNFIYNSAKPTDNADQLSKPEKNLVEPESFFQRKHRERLQNEHSRATKRKKRSLEKAREEYVKYHSVKRLAPD